MYYLSFYYYLLFSSFLTTNVSQNGVKYYVVRVYVYYLESKQNELRKVISAFDYHNKVM